MSYVADAVRKLFFNEHIIELAIRAYTRFALPQIEKSWGLFWSNRIKNIDETARLLGRGRITHPDRIIIGKFVRIGTGFYIHSSGGVTVGNGTIISRNVTIYSANHKRERGVYPYGDQYDERPVWIGRGVWIGMNVNILPGVTIRDGAVIGMGATVTHDVPAGAVVVGAKTRTVRLRDIPGMGEKYDDYFGRIWPEY